MKKEIDVVSQKKRRWPFWALVGISLCTLSLLVCLALYLAPAWYQKLSFAPFRTILSALHDRPVPLLVVSALLIVAIATILIRYALPLYSSPIRVFACLTTRLLAKAVWPFTGWRLFALLLLLFAVGGNVISQTIPPREERNLKTQPGKSTSAWTPSSWKESKYWIDPTGYLEGIGLFAILGFLLGAMRTRNRIVIDEFAYYSGDMEASAASGAEDKHARGVASMLSSYLVLTSGLYHDVNEQRFVLIPGVDLSVHDANIKTDGVNTELGNPVSNDTTFSVGPLKVPIGTLLALLGKLVRSPRIVGSLHRIEDSQGVRYLLQARLINHPRPLAWQVDSCEPSEAMNKSFRSELERNELLEEEVALQPGNSMSSSPSEAQTASGKTNMAAGSRPLPARTLDDLVAELASRIFTDLALKSTVRWRATCHFTQALRQYRHCLRTPEDRKLKLRKAEREIMKTLVEDEQFNWAFYNLGLIYTGLGQRDAAQAAFYRSIERQNLPQWETYYALAQNYYEQDRCGNYLYIVGLCEQVVSLKSNEARAYRLLCMAERNQAGSIRREVEKLKESASHAIDTKDVADLQRQIKEKEHNARKHLEAALRSGEDAVAWSWHALCTEYLRYRFRPLEENQLEQRHATARDCLHALALACMDLALLLDSTALEMEIQKEKQRKIDRTRGERNRLWRKAYWLLWQSRFVALQDVEISQTRGRLWLFASIWHDQIKGWDATLLRLCHWTDFWGRKYRPQPTSSEGSGPSHKIAALCRIDAMESFREALKMNQDAPQNWIYLYLALAEDEIRRRNAWKQCLDRACRIPEGAMDSCIEDYQRYSKRSGEQPVGIKRLQTIQERNELFNKVQKYRQEGWPAIDKLNREFIKVANEEDDAWKKGIVASALLVVSRNQGASMAGTQQMPSPSCDNGSNLNPTEIAMQALIATIDNLESTLPPKANLDEAAIWAYWNLAQHYLCLGRLCFEWDDRTRNARAEQGEERDLATLMCQIKEYKLEEEGFKRAELPDQRDEGIDDTVLFLKRAIWLLEDNGWTYQLRDQALYAYYAEALRRNGYRSPALYEAERALQKDPMSGYERSIYALVYNSYHELGRAYEAWQGALAWSADTPQYYLHLGHTALEAALRCRTSPERRKELILAGEHYQNVLALLDEGNCYEKGCAHHFLGRVLYELNRPVKAAPHFEIAATLGFAPIKSTYWVCWTLLRARMYSDCFATLPRLKMMMAPMEQAIKQADAPSQPMPEGAQTRKAQQQREVRKLSLLEPDADVVVSALSFEEVKFWYHLMRALCCTEGRLYSSRTSGQKKPDEDMMEADNILQCMEDGTTQRRCRKIWYCYRGWVDYLNWMANPGNKAIEEELKPIIQTMKMAVGMDAYPEACIRLAFVTMRLLDLRPDFPGAVGIRMDMAEHLRQVQAADLRGEFKQESDLIDAWLKKPAPSPLSALSPLAVVNNVAPTHNGQ